MKYITEALFVFIITVFIESQVQLSKEYNIYSQL